MLGLSVTLSHAQEVKQYILHHDLFQKRYGIIRDGDKIIFPVIKEFTVPFEFDVEFVTVEFDERQEMKTLREDLMPLLTEKERESLRTGFDTVGAIAIIDIPPELEEKEKIIGERILLLNKHLKTVLKKVGGHQGVYRTQNMVCIAGEDTRITQVIENGVRLRVDVEETYYSIRMATERRRILEKVKPGENILCLFSGVGPYPVTFSTHTKAERIVGIEINPKAHEFAIENVAKNRCTNVHLFCGDAHDIIPKLVKAGNRFDRITMPLPHTADEFLDDALAVSRVGTIIHYYTFLPENEFNKAIPVLQSAFERNGYALISYDVVRAGQHAPRVWRICIDAVVGAK